MPRMVLVDALSTTLARVARPSLVLAVAALLDQSTRRPPLTSFLLLAFG